MCVHDPTTSSPFNLSNFEYLVFTWRRILKLFPPELFLSYQTLHLFCMHIWLMEITTVSDLLLLLLVYMQCLRHEDGLFTYMMCKSCRLRFLSFKLCCNRINYTTSIFPLNGLMFLLFHGLFTISGCDINKSFILTPRFLAYSDPFVTRFGINICTNTAFF